MARGIVLVLACAGLLVPVTGLASGAYLGASLGRARVDDGYGHTHAWAVHGGYRFSDWWAVETSYADFDAATWSTCAGVCIPEDQVSSHLVASRVDLGVTGFLPLGKHVSLFGRAGLARLETDGHTGGMLGGGGVGSTVINESLSRKRTGATFGAGVDLRLLRSWSLRLQMSRENTGAGAALASWAGMTVSLGR